MRGDALVEVGHTNLVMDWRSSVWPWDIALELGFAGENDRLPFRNLAVVRATLDAVPDCGAGVLACPGRIGSPGPMVLRGHRHAPASGVAEVSAPPRHV